MAKTTKKGTEHTAQLNRLNKIEGQVRGLGSMIKEKRYCVDILTQIKAIKAALVSVEANIIEEHINHCVQTAINKRNKTETEKMLKEIKDLVKRARK